MKHDAPSTVLQTRVLRQYLFFLSKIVLSIFLRIFFLPWLFSGLFTEHPTVLCKLEWCCNTFLSLFVFLLLCLIPFFFSLKWMHEQIFQKLLKICNCFAVTLGLFFFYNIFSGLHVWLLVLSLQDIHSWWEQQQFGLLSVCKQYCFIVDWWTSRS